MTNREYWENRMVDRISDAEKIGHTTIKEILPLYEQALQNINKDINRLFVNYSEETGLDVLELSRVLSGADKNNFLKSIQAKMRHLGFDVSSVYNERYLSRLTRLEALKQQIYWEIQAIAPQEVDISEKNYKRIIQESYKTSTKDIREYLAEFEVYKDVEKLGTGAFATLDNSTVYEILRENWQGGNYNTRIWANNSMLNAKIQDVLPRVVGGGLLSGISQEKMQRQIREHFNVGRYYSMRLVRTETNYFLNQAELQSYKDEGIEYYEYLAILDNRTSETCEGLHGKTFKVEDAEVGFNYPPMHPNCRSDTFLVWKEEAKRTKVWSKEGWEEELRLQELEAKRAKKQEEDELYETQMKGLESEGYKREDMEMR